MIFAHAIVIAHHGLQGDLEVIIVDGVLEVVGVVVVLRDQHRREEMYFLEECSNKI